MKTGIINTEWHKHHREESFQPNQDQKCQKWNFDSEHQWMLKRKEQTNLPPLAPATGSSSPALVNTENRCHHVCVCTCPHVSQRPLHPCVSIQPAAQSALRALMALVCAGAREPAGHQLPAALAAPGQAWKGPLDLWGVLSVLSAIVALMVPRSRTQHS